jgi:hypothetical protein
MPSSHGPKDGNVPDTTLSMPERVFARVQTPTRLLKDSGYLDEENSSSFELAQSLERTLADTIWLAKFNPSLSGGREALEANLVLTYESSGVVDAMRQFRSEPGLTGEDLMRELTHHLITARDLSEATPTPRNR